MCEGKAVEEDKLRLCCAVPCINCSHYGGCCRCIGCSGKVRIIYYTITINYSMFVPVLRVVSSVVIGYYKCIVHRSMLCSSQHEVAVVVLLLFVV
jgi:hypothetical protein